VTGVIGDGPSLSVIDDLFVQPIAVLGLDRRVPVVVLALLAGDMQRAMRATTPLTSTNPRGLLPNLGALFGAEGGNSARRADHYGRCARECA
jgi:hypothetical protein